MCPWHLVVYFGDHRTRHLERRREVFDAEGEAVLAARIGRAHLQHHHIAWQAAAAKERPELRIGCRHDVEHARLGEGAVRARAAIGAKAQVVGVLRPQQAGIARAKKDPAAG